MSRAPWRALLMVAIAACHHRATAGATDRPAPATGDTLRGTFVLEGADPMTTAVLRTAGGRVVLDSMPPEMRRLVQLDVWARVASVNGRGVRVTEFRVRGADGQRAWDGVVKAADHGFALELLDDHSLHALRATPQSFAQLVGRRIWVTESATHTLATYGIIR